jgi:hypothetical protein
MSVMDSTLGSVRVGCKGGGGVMESASVVVGAAAVLLGAVVAGCFSMLVPHLQNRRDHARWLRETRLTAYGAYLAAIDLWMEASTIRWLEDRLANPVKDDSDYDAKLAVLEDEVSRAQSRVVLLGPDPVRAVAAEYHHAVLERIEATHTAESISEAVAIDLEQLRSVRGLMLGVMNRILGLAPLQ